MKGLLESINHDIGSVPRSGAKIICVLVSVSIKKQVSLLDVYDAARILI